MTDEAGISEIPAQAPADGGAEPAPEAVERPIPESLAEASGHPGVDAVLASLVGLEEQPVGEHVAVFENAHEALRRALNDAGEA